MPALTPAGRHAEAARARMAERILESRRLEADWADQLDPQQRADLDAQG